MGLGIEFCSFVTYKLYVFLQITLYEIHMKKKYIYSCEIGLDCTLRTAVQDLALFSAVHLNLIGHILLEFGLEFEFEFFLPEIFFFFFIK